METPYLLPEYLNQVPDEHGNDYALVMAARCLIHALEERAHPKATILKEADWVAAGKFHLERYREGN